MSAEDEFALLEAKAKIRKQRAERIKQVPPPPTPLIGSRTPRR